METNGHLNTTAKSPRRASKGKWNSNGMVKLNLAIGKPSAPLRPSLRPSRAAVSLPPPAAESVLTGKFQPPSSVTSGTAKRLCWARKLLLNQSVSDQATAFSQPQIWQG